MIFLTFYCCFTKSAFETHILLLAFLNITENYVQASTRLRTFDTRLNYLTINDFIKIIKHVRVIKRHLKN